jgi:hypothetical protein
MKKFTVEIREVHVSYREVEADTLEDAVKRGKYPGFETHIEYSHTPDMPIRVFDTETCERITEDYGSLSDEEKKRVR